MLRYVAVGLCSWFSLVAFAGEPAAEYHSVDELWRDFDPRALPIEPQVVKETQAGGIVWRTVYYTSEVSDGFKVRVAAYYGFPVGGSHLPAILHVHGGGQNATLDYVKYWAHRGYAALSIDWGGKPLENNPANGKTDWGPLPYNQNSDDTGNVYNTSPNARANSWYHWTIAARRGITFFEQQPEVDPMRIGSFGISMGGRLQWLIAGTEHRLRCVAAVVGATMMDEPQPGVPGSEFVADLAANPVWRETLDAWAYAPKITAPFFVLSASDDFYNRIDNGERTLQRIPGDRHWRSYSMHFSHHIDEAESPALVMWMDRWLRDGPAWPHSPEIRLRLDASDHVPVAEVEPDATATVRSVEIHYSTGQFQQSRFWQTIDGRRQGSRWSAAMPIAENKIGLRAFATVRYASGLVVSTNEAMPDAAEIEGAHVAVTAKPNPLIDDFHRGAVDWFVTEASPNVLLAERHFFRVLDDGRGGTAITCDQTASGGWRVFTHKLADPEWTGPVGAGLALDVKTEQPNTITVLVVENYEAQPWPARPFAASAKILGGKWETVSFRQGDFKDIYTGEPIATWEHVNLLGIFGQYRFTGNHMQLPVRVLGPAWQGPPPEIARIRWINSP